MRAPQRKFAVEYKSRSRKAKPNTSKSIWGDTDLKAVSRALEEADSRFASPEEAPESANASPAHMEMQAAMPALDETSSLGSTGAFLVDTSEAAAPVSATEQVPAARPLPAGSGRRGKSRTAKRLKLRTPRGGHDQPVADERAASVARAELDLLMEENAHLKAELRRQLMADNERLREMLTRFL